MSSQKSIKLYIYESETSSLPFCYPSGEQVEICAFKYNAKRMGGTPTITCTLKSQDCLDSYWTNSIYCVFRDEKFYLRQTPSGTKSNTEYGYSYSLEFVSERDVLNNVYIFDAVNTDEGFDKPASNSTKISFFGDINRFADKINASLRYSGLQTKDSKGNIIGYEVVVDGGITSEEKYISIENTFFSNAIQEAYNTFEIPYYFKGKKIHIGYKDALIPRVFKYGVDDSLLSIKRENANNKIVNRATGIGSEDNIPYYYPNNSPKGDIGVVASERLSVKIVDYNRFASTVDIDEVLTYTVGNASVVLRQWSDDGNRYNAVSAYPVDCVSGQTTKKWFRSRISIKKTARYKVKGDLKFNGTESEDFIKYIDFISLQDEKFVEIPRVFNKEDGYFDLGVKEAGDYWVVFGFQFTYRGTQRYYVTFNPVLEFESGWKNSKGKSITLSDAGLKMAGGPEPEDGDTIKQILIKRVNTTSNLMPSIYRETDGKERFYNAINGEYVDESGNPIVFNNPYIDGRPSENIVSVEEIKPTIKDTKNSSGQQIDMFSEIAYDEGDNDEVYTDSEGNTSYMHPHFFAKLRKLPFNLFDCAIEGSEMTFSITKGDCGACSFKIKVDDEFPYRNTVQVYEEDTVDNNGVLHRKGTLVRDDDGRVLCGLDGFQSKVIPQAIQQDTINNEVWIALEKEEETYGILMPKAPKYNDNGEVVEAGYRIKPCSSDAANDGDTFVILNINLPKEYIIAAEKRLEDTIIANMKDNNDERFNFSITFSSIFFEEHPEILSLLDENSQINIEYAGEPITQYVSSFSYSMNSGSALPSISVDLSDSLSVSKNSIKTAIKQVQLNVQKALEHSSVAQQVAFISKIENDVVNSNIDFRKGIKFGDGGQVEIDEYNNTKLVIDYLTVNKKAIFTALDVQDMHHIGGRVLITPASMICNKVEEFADFYRCFFQNYDDGGNQIFNNFVVDDQAICKTFNTWGTTYYWRLVVGVGNDYIDLSKTDCDEGSDTPRAGDKIVQLGNRSTDDNSRKSAIEISSYGDNTPSLVMYTDIDSYSLESKEIHGTIYRNNDGEYEAYFYNYGSMRLGAKEGEEGGYITYDHTSKQLNINAIVNFLPQSTGLEQMESYQKLVKIAQGNIETWFYDGVSPIQSGAPTISNYPVNTWEAGDYENHIGDIYYSDTGKGYRFKKSGSSWEWEIISDAEMARLMAEVQNLQYLKTALSDGTTTVAGGLILTSLIQLGYKDAQDVRHTMAGISGLGQNSKSPAAWYGGPMVDHEQNPTATEFARSLFRFDGTGYLASGNITWDANGYGQVGGKGDDYAIKWNNNGVFLGSGMKITESGQETLATLLEAVSELRSWFGEDEHGDIYIKNDDNGRPRGFYTYSFLSAGGKGESSSGGSSADYTQWGWDDIIQLTSDPGLGNLASAWALKQEYDSRQSALSVLSQGLSSIRLLIPSSASESNQLADKEFVNSSIASNTATFRGTFEGVSYLPSGAKLNDYAFVIATDASGNPEYDRYKYTSSGWVFEYTLNNSSFTAEQWSAITSGITANLVSLYSGHIADKSNPHGVTASQIGALTKHQNIYTLTLKVNGTQVGTYKANKKDATISIADVASKNALEAHIANQSNPHAVTKAQIGLADVENIKLSSWAGSTNITTLGAVTTGEWKASKIANDYLVNSSIRIGSTKVALGGAIEALSGIASISLKGNNDAKLTYDNGAWHLSGNLLVDGYITAGGVGSSSGGGGIDSAAMWALLGDATNEQINKTHISAALEGYQTIIPDLATIRNNAANGNTAYGWGNHSGLYLRWAGSHSDASAQAWGTLTPTNGYGTASHASTPDGGDIVWAYKDGKISNQLDGWFYQNEGQYRCLDTSDAGSFAPASHTHSQYLTGITSSMVTSALGYTPYNASNPNGYISGISKAMVENVLTGNITSHTHSHLVNDSGNASGEFLFHASSGATGEVGNMDAYGAWGHPANSQDSVYSNAYIARLKWSDNYYTDLFTGPNEAGSTYGLQWRQIVNSKATNWRILLDTANFNTYAPNLTGAGASGTWGINISGNAATATKLQTPRTIWGQSFDGTKNISGALTEVTDITASGNATIAGKLDINGEVRAAAFRFDGNANRYTKYEQSVSMFMPSSKGWAGGLSWLTNSGDLILELGYYYDGGYGNDFFYFGYGASYSNPVNVMLPNGNIGIGTPDPSAKLHVAGNILATGAITAGTASDSRLKSNIATLVNASSVLRQLRGVGFDWNALATDKSSYFKGHDVGLIAQEVEPLIPSAIGTIWGEYKRLDYAKITPYLVEGWKEHDKEIDRLRKRVSELESEVNKLRNYVN